MARSAPDISDEHLAMTSGMFQECVSKGWYVGDQRSLLRTRSVRTGPAPTTPELVFMLQLSRDKMHHSVGWWRNAEYEYCWHLSMSVRERLAFAKDGLAAPLEEISQGERRYWARAVFRHQWDKLWIEPGGTDPRLTREKAIRHAKILHMRMFLDPETFQPFIPQGEVYDLTRWIPGLTPDKVDRV